jgi:succinoglycan biosynthesis transport protein ExoP
MDFQQFLLALRARRKAFVMVFAAAVVTAMAVALIIPKKYVSTATLLLDARDEQAMTASRMSPRERSGYVATQVDLIQSGRVAAQVSRDLKLAQKPGWREAFDSDTGGVGNIDDWIGAQLLEKLRVDTSASNVLTVQFSSSDARTAAEIANGFAKAYLDTALALRTEPTRDAAAWFSDQMKGLRTQVSQAQSKLAAYQKQKGIAFADERTDVDGARLSELSTQYLAARNATYEASSRHKQAAEALKGATVEEIPEVLASGHISALKVDLGRAEARLAEMGEVLGPNHPQYQRTSAEVAGLRSKVATEMKRIVAGLGNTVEQARRREEELKQAITAQSERVQQLKEARIEMAVMTRDVENAQRTYDAVLARFTANKIDSAAKTTNVALLTPAIEPIKPAHPKLGLIAGLALVVGLLLAAAIVYLLETLDRRVRSRADLESRLAVPSFGRLSRWQPAGGRLLPVPLRTARALPHPW